MKYQPTINVWALDDTALAALQPGQWVCAGSDRNAAKGRWWGVKASGSKVVAWLDNARGRGPGGYAAYQRTLRDYAKS